MESINEDKYISYSIEELDFCENGENVKTNSVDINKLLNEIEQTELENHDDFMIPHIIHYNENFTVKELLQICEYYGFSKELKANKCNKEQIIQCLVSFESDPTNSDIVFRRQNMWFYMNELKADKFMKKFVLW